VALVPSDAVARTVTTRSACEDCKRGGEHDLVERLLAGDDEALEELLDRYAGSLVAVAAAVSGDTTFAEAAVSGDTTFAEAVVCEVIVAAWTHPHRVAEGVGSLRDRLAAQVHELSLEGAHSARTGGPVVGVGDRRPAASPRASPISRRPDRGAGG
jgi:hypothetical protein